MSTLFDSYLMVDWSGASVPVRGRNSIWLGLARRGAPAAVENPPTRHAAMARIRQHLGRELAAGRRVLAGFDFPFGYPAGVARRITGQASALALWEWLAGRIEDGLDNANTRFEIAAEVNRLYDGIGPFWGRPADWHHPDIPVGGRERRGEHPPERRLADRTAKGAKTVWQLAYAGSVGSQALLGLPALARLRAAPELAGRCAVWPFETGLAAPDAAGAPLVLAEIYPSLFSVSRAEGGVQDAAQVRTVAERLRDLDVDGGLAPMFAGPDGLDEAERAAIVAEEAWILGLGHEHLLRPACPGAAGTPRRPPLLRYERDPAEIYRRSFETVRAEARLDHLPADLREVAVRLVHACGMPDITARLAWSEDLARSAREALGQGAPVLCDCQAVASMVTRPQAGNPVVCTLGEPEVPGIATRLGTTRSAASVELWAGRIAGAVVAIGNAPTALFRLLELIDEGWPRPAAILGFPVGFVGAAESKAELAARPRGVPFLTLRGRRGGSAMAAAAVNALAVRGTA